MVETNIDWLRVGFRRRPLPRSSRAGEHVFRAWGGTSSMRGNPSGAGVHFSHTCPQDQLDAEELFAVFEWGNRCNKVTEFLIPSGTLLWVGEVHPGDPRAAFGMSFGTQIFIENPAAQSLVPFATRPLSGGLGKNLLHGGRPPRIGS